MHRVAAYGFDDLGAKTLVMVADPEYLAIRIYRSVGFDGTETQTELNQKPRVAPPDPAGGVPARDTRYGRSGGRSLGGTMGPGRREYEMLLATTRVEDVERFLSIFSTKGAEKRGKHGSRGRPSSAIPTTRRESG